MTVTYRMPEWAPRDGADASLTEKWRLYEAHLLKHEKGHAAHGIAAGEEVRSALSKVPPRETCGELDEAANRLGQSILDKYKADDVTYDATTKHGATQGAVFP